MNIIIPLISTIVWAFCLCYELYLIRVKKEACRIGCSVFCLSFSVILLIHALFFQK